MNLATNSEIRRVVSEMRMFEVRCLNSKEVELVEIFAVSDRGCQMLNETQDNQPKNLRSFELNFKRL